MHDHSKHHTHHAHHKKANYRPLVVIFASILAFALVRGYWGYGSGVVAMESFMGGFFIVFSIFKLLDLKGFADAYQTYDIVAQRSRVYAYLYPFIELGLGIAYLTSYNPIATNVVTLAVMGVSTVGVARAMLGHKKFKCACLGTFFDLEVSKVTLFEDILMAVMSAGMLLFIT